MKKIMLICIVLLCTIITNAQNTFKAFIKDVKEKQPLQGATVTIKTLNKSTAADSLGFVILKNITAGKQEIVISHVGFQDKELSLTFPLVSDEPIEILLNEAEKESEEEVVITATRSSRSIANIPTRVETISGEELEEKGNMKP
ncbi:MAG: carboxypeptidase-like regulatory domain-containing protein, partial [Ferruginibacter sp.]